MTQLLACMLLHIELCNEVKQAIFMLKYLNDYPEKFTKTFPPLLIAMMQLTSGIFSEIVNIVMLATRHDVIHCLEHFVAFEILTHIDDLYAEALPHFPLKKEIETSLYYDIKRPFKERSFSQKIVRVFYKTVIVVYQSVYYYFTPFLILYLPYFWAFNNQHDDANCRRLLGAGSASAETAAKCLSRCLGSAASSADASICHRMLEDL